MDEQMQDDQLEPTYNSSVLKQDVALKTYPKQWMIEMGSERGSDRSVLAAQQDGVYIYIYISKLTLTLGYKLSQ